jgi:protein-S-isoprenylcysteine O-methyltransferase Ste14
MTRGLYSKLRHPIYYFSILAVVGIGIYAWSLLMLVPIVLLVVLEVYRIREEEKALAKKFGTDYARYKEQTWF